MKKRKKISKEELVKTLVVFGSVIMILAIILLIDNCKNYHSVLPVKEDTVAVQGTVESVKRRDKLWVITIKEDNNKYYLNYLNLDYETYDRKNPQKYIKENDQVVMLCLNEKHIAEMKVNDSYILTFDKYYNDLKKHKIDSLTEALVPGCIYMGLSLIVFSLAFFFYRHKPKQKDDTENNNG